MHFIKDYITIVEAACNILKKDNSNQTASRIRAIASNALFQSGYPCYLTEDGFGLEVGAYQFFVSNDELTDAANRTSHDPEQGIRLARVEEENRRLIAEKAALKDRLLDLFTDMPEQHLPTGVIINGETEDPDDPVKNAALWEGISAQEQADPDQTEEAETELELQGLEELVEIEVDEQEPGEDDTVPLSVRHTQQQSAAGEDDTVPLNIARKKAENPEPATPVPPTQPQETVTAAPAEEGSSYRESLRKSEFAISYQKVTIGKTDNNMTSSCEIIASPLSMDEGEVDIIVWGGSTVKTETRMSENGRKSVLVEVGAAPLIVTGFVRDGVFHTNIETTIKMKNAGILVESEEIVYDGKGHIILEDDGIKIHVIPLSQRNKTSAESAEFCYAVISRDEAPIFGDNGGRESITFRYHGQLFELRCKWVDDTLYGAARPVE